MKLDVIPAIKLNNGSFPSIISLKKIPIAAPMPPTHGPKKTAKTAGTTTGGQNRTPSNLTGITE